MKAESKLSPAAERLAAATQAITTAGNTLSMGAATERARLLLLKSGNTRPNGLQSLQSSRRTSR